jgi:2-iminobutanoate/2-iminopropanoate deaminase
MMARWEVSRRPDISAYGHAVESQCKGSDDMPAKVTHNNPPAVRAPTGYTHSVEVSGDYRRLIISGQVGIALDGSVPTSAEGQVAQALANLRAVLSANGMAVENIVKTTAFLTDRGLLDAYRQARRATFGDHAPASTLLFVAGLADPRWVVEIEAEAVA